MGVVIKYTSPLPLILQKKYTERKSLQIEVGYFCILYKFSTESIARDIDSYIPVVSANEIIEAEICLFASRKIKQKCFTPRTTNNNVCNRIISYVRTVFIEFTGKLKSRKLQKYLVPLLNFYFLNI